MASNDVIDRRILVLSSVVVLGAIMSILDKRRGPPSLAEPVGGDYFAEEPEEHVEAGRR